MKRYSYGGRDSFFGQAMLTLRMNIGLTQAGLAELLHVSRRAVGQWEAGSVYPTAEHLKQIITLGVQASAFAAGREAEEIRALWHAAHQKLLFDESWLAALPGRPGPVLTLLPSVPPEESRPGEVSAAKPALWRRVDWGDALVVPTFYGREEELAILTKWVLGERCQVVSVLGMGGIGKSALVASLMHQVASHFEVVLWRSLRDAPNCEALLDDCLRVLSPQPLREVSTSLEQRLGLLLEYLREARALLVLDNLEVLLEEGQGTGHMRAGYEDYGRLLHRVAGTAHQSCLLLTSREKPIDLVPLEGSLTPVRFLRLDGLDARASVQLLVERDVAGTPPEREWLIERYGGNPLALKIVAQTIVELFGGEIAPFLEQGEVVFGSVRELLGEQFDRLSAAEQTVLLWLAIVREPVSIKELLPVLGAPLLRAQVLEAVEALRRRSLLERGHRVGSFMLQSVVLEYATARLIAEATWEIEHGQLVRLIEHGLELATVKEYVRQTQQRLLVAPLLAQVRRVYSGRVAVEGQLLAQLEQLRAQADDVQGYGPGNMLALLRNQRGHLRGLDLSQLSIRGASLQGVEMQDTTLAEATLHDTTFTEALDATRAVAISRNGQYWAAGSWRGKVRVWQQGGKLLYLAWQAHTSTVSTLAFSPDGRTLATGSWDGALKLWDVESGDLLWTSWRTNNIQTLAFSPDGHMIASGGNDGTVQLWDARQGTHRQTLPGQSGAVYALAWSPDGRLLASGGLDGGIRLWELSGAQPEAFVRMFTGHTDWVFALAFAPGGRTLASGSFDRTVKLWDVGEEGSLHVRQTLTGHTDKVRAITWSPDGRILASCGFDRVIWLWDVERDNYRMALPGHTAAVHGLAFTPDSSSLLSGSDDGTLRVWDVANGQCIHILQGYAVSLYDVAWSPDGSRLASAGSDTLVSVWEVEGRTPPRLLRGHRWIVHGIAWSPDGWLLASCGWDNAIRVWDANTGETRQILRDPDHVDTFFYGVAWSPDGKFLASGSYQRGVYVWEVTTSTCHWVGHTSPAIIRRIEWSPDGMLLASCSNDGRICLWEASDGRLRATLQGHGSMMESVSWSPDGTRLAGGGGGQGRGELFVWDAQSGELLYALSELSGMIYALAWDPSGAVLVSGDGDGALRWWNMQRGKCVQVCRAHQGTVQSLRCIPDGAELASCGDDGAIMLWDLHSGEQLRTLRRDRPYERLNISGVKGLTEAQRASLRALGAIEERGVPLTAAQAIPTSPRQNETSNLPGPAQAMPAQTSVAQSLPDPLSRREMEVLRLLAGGASNREIAAALVLAPGTVKLHVSHILSKLGVKSRTRAILRARDLRLLPDAPTAP
ncbi:MAG TPA: LuxR C-terminal-related transcriptional regulator [Ktedonobacteraceae bacterium]